MDENPLAGPIDVDQMIMMMIEQMASIAWQKLGLQPDMITGQIAKDIPQAKTAIDVTTHLATFIEPKLDDSDKQRLHDLIRDLRMNWVQKSGEGTN